MVLFDGAALKPTALPWTYVPVWLWLATPPVILMGLALSVVLLRQVESRIPTVALWGTVGFPVLYVMGTHATLFDGLRHLLFIVPTFTVLAVAAWVALWRSSKGAWRAVVVATLAVGVAEPLLFQWRNHPNQIAYIQPLAGGPRAAYARYDLDYWGNCVLQALGDVNSRSSADRIYVSGWPLIVIQADVSRFPRLALADPRDPRVSAFVTIARGDRRGLLTLAANASIQSRVTTADGALLCAVSKTDTTPQQGLPPAERGQAAR